MMRLRFLVIPILMLFCVVAVYNVCNEQGAVDTVVGMARRVTYGALFAIGFCSASLVLRKWMGHQPVRPASPTISSPPPLPTFGVPSANNVQLPNGPGKYRVSGVDHDTKFEISEIVYADSPANAKFKVELKGVEVGMVERAG